MLRLKWQHKDSEMQSFYFTKKFLDFMNLYSHVGRQLVEGLTAIGVNDLAIKSCCIKKIIIILKIERKPLLAD
jgi:hypothetical protein